MKVTRYFCFVLLAAALSTTVSVPSYSQAAQQSPAPPDAQAKPDSSAAKKDTTKSADARGKAAAPAAGTPSATQPPAPIPSASSSAPKPAATQQPGDANSGGMVWVNTDSGVYHKPGSRYYGKTKVGKYMTEADAKKAGYRAAKKQ